ncbi:hypothetical protein [Ralstonia pseudosolanacearum]|uniref:hypothetical protein n=1 Tax=Ralstonia pseudosolanacearum TaxID=1310165 RepID=UPI0018D19F3A|nr:hypothetical protein [Ralstonia pseudosolanacearum]UWD91207.1 hypothetical protein NY025_09100 [Ralstonia pseudosolanacearum]CAH0445173.1 hypothetical protein LMG9673_04559 [Ralstonia pseudosolanacearum]
MPILSGDVKLLAAERLLDTPDGGGRMTGHVVVDGQSNNLFPDISELDRTYGRVALRKAFVGVLTDSTDSYYGAHAIVADAPSDPRVSVTLFTTRSWTDRREAARDRVERYLARGVKWPGQLLERQLTGQRAITLLLKPADTLPRVGQALVLVQDEAKPTEIEQYVRITRITTTEREFTVSEGGGTIKFDGIVATCEISDPLRFDFEGPSPSNRDDVSAKAVVRDTIVANAAVYYGIAPTVAEAKVGDLRVQVPGLFGQLVPSAQSETPLVDLNAAGQAVPLLESGNGVLTTTANGQVASGRNLYLGNPLVPGSLRVTGGGYTFTDAAGQLKSGSSVIGTVDYARGLVAFKDGTPGFGGDFQVSFRPAGAPVRVADTAAIAIAQENRGYAYTITLSPPPKPGALIVSYMAQGKWYDLRDQGDGAIRGTDSSFGAGTLDYVTGSVILTTGALPDANTAILFSWGTGASYFNRVGVPVEPPTVRHTVAHPGIAPGSLRITWPDGARQRLATDDGHGVITGDGSGTVRYARGELVFRPAVLPAGGAELTIDYEWGPPQEANFAHPLRNADGTVTVRLPQSDLRPNTVELEFNLLIENYQTISGTPAEMQVVQRVDPIKIARDTGAGAFDSAVVGHIDYTASTITFRPDATVNIPFARYSVQQLGWTVEGSERRPVYRNTFSHWEYKPAGAAMPIDESGYVKVRYRAADTANAATETVTLAQLEVDLTDRYAEAIVPGSVRFSLGGKVYVDRLGTLVTDINANTGAGTQAGTIDYASGRARLAVWQPGAGNVVSMQSLLTELGGQPVDEVTFRVPAAPVRPGSLQIRAAPLTGGQITAAANADGTIAAAGLLGTVDYQTGVVRIRFGRFVPAAGRESEIWYSADAVRNGQIFQPLPVRADTLRFNAVAFTYLPLSADVLGLDPVRLPLDGRVPIFRTGDVAVVHHTATTPFAANARAGDALDVGRVRLAALRVLDANGKPVSTDLYTTDLDTGTVTLRGSPAGLALPLVAEHRIEDMGLISDTQINGVLTLTRALTHDYPARESRVSSALIIGDLQARAHTLFAQQTWTGEWKDVRIGANTIAQYNETVYPVEVTNRGAIEERWALIFTNTNEFRVVGESVGQIAVGNTATDLAPVNPETHAPYFTLRAGGWGSGWAAGNVLRLSTAAANFPVWVARTTLQGPATQTSDAFQIQIRGDIDR